MSNSVYWDREQERWAGYAVPAQCDEPDCRTRIDRGLGYKCEEVVTFDDDDDEVISEGCGLFFCEDHLYSPTCHPGVTPKGESRDWLEHILTDESWSDWRDFNPGEVARYRIQLEAQQ